MTRVYVLLALICLGFAGCAGSSPKPVPPPTPIDNNTYIINFFQPTIYTDNTTMLDVPTREIQGYRLYVCHIIGPGVIDSMVLVGEISNPLVWDTDAWRGKWDITSIIHSNVYNALKGVMPDNTHALSLRAISVRVDTNGIPYISSFSQPIIFGEPALVLDNITNIKGGDANAPVPVGNSMQFGINGGR